MAPAGQSYHARRPTQVSRPLSSTLQQLLSTCCGTKPPITPRLLLAFKDTQINAVESITLCRCMEDSSGR